jgi:S1-C subfamily serine protease
VAVSESSVAGRLGHLPLLPVGPGTPPPAAGQPIVLLGYPTGLDALLARLDDEVLKGILDASGGEPQRVTAELARVGRIRPLATQGHLSDILPTRLVYDAQTTLGGSGGPVLNASGRVIGVNAAILTDFSGASFGVPIRFAADLLPAPAPPPVSSPRKKTTK